MSKRPQLDINALNFAGGEPRNPVAAVEEKRAGAARQISRIGKVPVQAWVLKDTRKRLRRVALEMDTNVDELINELIDGFLKNHRS